MQISENSEIESEYQTTLPISSCNFNFYMKIKIQDKLEVIYLKVFRDFDITYWEGNLSLEIMKNRDPVWNHFSSLKNLFEFMKESFQSKEVELDFTDKKFIQLKFWNTIVKGKFSSKIFYEILLKSESGDMNYTINQISENLNKINQKFRNFVTEEPIYKSQIDEILNQKLSDFEKKIEIKYELKIKEIQTKYDTEINNLNLKISNSTNNNSSIPTTNKDNSILLSSNNVNIFLISWVILYQMH
jgi:hypothetical protein